MARPFTILKKKTYKQTFKMNPYSFDHDDAGGCRYSSAGLHGVARRNMGFLTLIVVRSSYPDECDDIREAFFTVLMRYLSILISEEPG
jgi:hypothetical protein